MAKTNPVKEKLRQGESALGFVLLFGSDLSAEAAARAGFDFGLLDIQHGSWDLATSHRALCALSNASVVPMARVARNEPFAIGSMLDRGALGIVVPMVNSAEEARAAVASARFQPRGSRSAGSYLASYHGADYEEWIERELFLAMQIESEQAVENAKAILSVEGVDGCWIGPGDLSRSLGIDRHAAEGRRVLEAAALRVREACEKTGKVAGIWAAEDAPHWLELGFRFVTVGDEAGFLADGAQAALKRCR